MKANKQTNPPPTSDPATMALTYLDALYPGPEMPRFFRAPGRVNLIGEHTDYNDGFVLPVAIDLQMVMAVRPRNDRLLRVQSLVQTQPLALNLDTAKVPDSSWGSYVAAVARALQNRDLELKGFDGVLVSTIPIDSGLSSSAALTVLTAVIFQHLGNWKLPPAEIISLCRQAEADAVGVRCGSMDPMVVLLGKEGHALFIDCRDLDYQPVSLPGPDINIVVCDSGIPRKLAASAYNQRRQECEQGVSALKTYLPAIRSLRDVAWKDFLTLEQHVLEPVRKRCRHVIGENYRVHNAVTALEAGDWEALGQLFFDSHQSLRDDYEVSCPELDCLVEAARGVPGTLGARLTGAGFGGCTVNLVRSEAVPRFQTDVKRRFHEAFQGDPAIYVSRAVDGAGELIPANRQPVMSKRQILKEDGRYLIYYTFEDKTF